ncbi:Hypothetical predicted protein [Marmota monax]|uniref:Uncharacterized protein n=1 Tax=Marmota monax TaxID=9995 RepID=A0A5E4BF38_MARMO|nr:hypothetical protein GHT09_011289 [Marmota monax]VTJ68188.1 Hypothetical predicted protein [Marmota monax]
MGQRPGLAWNPRVDTQDVSSLQPDPLRIQKAKEAEQRVPKVSSEAETSLQHQNKNLVLKFTCECRIEKKRGISQPGERLPGSQPDQTLQGTFVPGMHINIKWLPPLIASKVLICDVRD